MRNKGIRIVFITVFAELMTEVVCGLWGKLPWREYAAVCELRYSYRANGALHHAFESSPTDDAQYEILQILRDEWLSPTGLVAHMREQATSENAIRCLESATIKIRRQQSCIIVRTESFSPDVASNCTETLTRAIVADHVNREVDRTNRMRAQIEKECKKYQKHKEWLERRLAQHRTLTKDGKKDEALNREIEFARKALDGLHTTMENLCNRDLWSSSIEKSCEYTFLIPPNRTTVYFIVLGICLLLFLMTHHIIDLYYRLTRGRWSLKGTVKKQ